MKKILIITLGLLLLISMMGALSSNALNIQNKSSFCRCQPNQSCWPSKKVWSGLAKQLSGRLVKPVSPIIACKKDFHSNVCAVELKRVKNPFYLQTIPGGTENQG